MRHIFCFSRHHCCRSSSPWYLVLVVSNVFQLDVGAFGKWGCCICVNFLFCFTFLAFCVLNIVKVVAVAVVAITLISEISPELFLNVVFLWSFCRDCNMMWGWLWLKSWLEHRKMRELSLALFLDDRVVISSSPPPSPSILTHTFVRWPKSLVSRALVFFAPWNLSYHALWFFSLPEISRITRSASFRSPKSLVSRALLLFARRNLSHHIRKHSFSLHIFMNSIQLYKERGWKKSESTTNEGLCLKRE